MAVGAKRCALDLKVGILLQESEKEKLCFSLRVWNVVLHACSSVVYPDAEAGKVKVS